MLLKERLYKLYSYKYVNLFFEGNVFCIQWFTLLNVLNCLICVDIGFCWSDFG